MGIEDNGCWYSPQGSNLQYVQKIYDKNKKPIKKKKGMWDNFKSIFGFGGDEQ